MLYICVVLASHPGVDGSPIHPNVPVVENALHDKHIINGPCIVMCAALRYIFSRYVKMLGPK